MALRTAAIDRLANDEHESITELLVGIAVDSKQSSQIRNQALLALEGRNPPPMHPLLGLFKQNDDAVQRQLVRTLSTYGVSEEMRDAFVTHHASATNAVAEQIELALRFGWS